MNKARTGSMKRKGIMGEDSSDRCVTIVMKGRVF